MKHLFIIFSILLLSSPLFGDTHKGETLYLWKISSSVQWYRFGDKYTRPQYKGEVENGKPNGLGVLIYPYNGKSIVGEWKNGKEWKTKHRTKYGSLIWKFEMEKNGQGMSTSLYGEKYVGEWKNGNPNGQGTLTFPDGYKYVGEWKDGKEHGHGTYIWFDGTKYVGEWKDGKTWNGTEYDKNGNIIGKWVNGVLQK